MALIREVELVDDDDGAVRYVESYVDAAGSACDESEAVTYVGRYVDAAGLTVRKEWGKVTRRPPPPTP